MTSNRLCPASVFAVALCLVLTSGKCPAQSTTSKWRIVPTKNEMTDQVTETAKAAVTGAHGELISVQAVCNSGIMIALNFFSENPNSTLSCNDLDVRMGERAVEKQKPDSCTDDYTVAIFPDPPGFTQYRLKEAKKESGADLFPAMGALFDIAVGSSSSLSASVIDKEYPIKMADLVDASILRIAVPLKTGGQVVFKSDLREQPIHTFIASCVGSMRSTPPARQQNEPTRSLDSNQDSNLGRRPNPVEPERPKHPLRPARNLVVTRSDPTATGTATIIAPGAGNHRYNFAYIDTKDFKNGGTLEIEIAIDGDSETDGSFDLFQGNVNVPTQGRLGNLPLAGAYDVRKGTAKYLRYRFPAGDVFKLGLEGNWGSSINATGQVTYQVKVSE